MADTTSDEMLSVVNILLVSESASDRAITLNALENYLKFPKFEQALSSLDSFTNVVPMKFVLPDPESNLPIQIVSNSSIKFEQPSGSTECSTPEVRHTISFAKYALNIIDTPNMNSENDEKVYLKSFTDYLQSTLKLDSIVFVVNGAEERSNKLIKCCIKELLLSRNACCHNIRFCFTNSRSSVFGPGEGFSALEKTLYDVDLRLKPGENAFFVDNEAFRFLVAKKQGYPAPLDASNKCWDKSAEQIELMVDYILQISLPNVFQTDSSEDDDQSSKDNKTFNDTSLPEFNILLLGETGAGKSTTLNALANYLKYNTFENALKSLNDFTEVIPSQFSLPDPKTGESMLIKSNSPTDGSERHIVGCSSTTCTIGYKFTFPTYVLRIIDTPGIGDTGGAEEDKKNFENIMNYLQYHQNLNAVVLIVNGNESRKTAYFKYCITELLTYLHRSLSKNMMFCFTYSRNSLYGAGEGFATLKTFLENEIKEVKIKLVPGENCFFIENEAYRFLVAKKYGYQIPDVQKIGCDVSWNHSTEQIKQMIERILQFEPHNLRKTISLNNTRKIIIELAQPMVEMQKNIADNIKRIELQEKQLNDFNQSKGQLEQLLRFEVDDLQLKALSEPSIVCTSRSCIEVINTEGHIQVHYHTKCHEGCSCNLLVTPNMTNQHLLKFCYIMSWTQPLFSVTCKRCQCSWKEHMYIISQYEKVKRSVVDLNVQGQIHDHEKLIRQISDAKLEAQKLLTELREELKPHNKYFEQYLDCLIEEERKKENPNPEMLKAMKLEHQKNVQLLNKAIETKSKVPILIEDVPELKQRLLQLKHSGPQFRQILKANKMIQKRNFKYWDKIVASIPGESAFSKLLRKKFLN